MRIDLKGNAVAAILEQVAVGSSFLIFYGVLIRVVGAEMVGILSLVLILSSLGSVANAGFASAAARFVPLFEGRGDRAGTIACVQTTVLCMLALYVVTLLVAYLPFRSLITAQAGAQHADLVAQLLVPAAGHVLMMGSGAGTSMALTGLQRSDLRAWSNVAGVAVMGVVLALSVGRHGLVAGIWAMFAQSATVAALTWIQLRRVLPGLPFVPRSLDLSLARKMLGMGLNLQAQSVMIAAIDPIARLLIGHFGALADVAWFSMASRFVFQIRALIFAASQPLLSAFTFLGEADAKGRAQLYARVTAVIAFASVLTLSASAGASPFVGEVWIGQPQPAFVAQACLLAAGWLTNTMTLSSYFLAYASGRMAWNLTAHVVLVLVTVLAGAGLGAIWPPLGVAVGMAVGLTVFGLVIEIGNGAIVPLPRRRLADHLMLIAAAVVAAAAAVLIYPCLRTKVGAWPSGVASGLVWLGVVIVPAILHPVGREALGWLRSVVRPAAARKAA